MEGQAPKRAGVVTVAVGNATWRRAVFLTDSAFDESCTAAVPVRAFVEALRSAVTALGTPEAPVVLAGVVPGTVKRLEKALRARFRVYRFRRDFPCPIEIVPRPARAVGDDRLAAALGALALDASVPWVVLDAGTALTVNAVRPLPGNSGTDRTSGLSPNLRVRRLGRFEGGLIVPGEALALRALHGGTAQLPALKPWSKGHAPVIGHSTGEAMRAGVRRAQVAAACALARAQAEHLGSRTRIALTGGGAEVLWPAVRRELWRWRPVLVPDLVLRGLYVAWQFHRKTEP
jgi:type III pantothenate kinase